MHHFYAKRSPPTCIIIRLFNKRLITDALAQRTCVLIHSKTKARVRCTSNSNWEHVEHSFDDETRRFEHGALREGSTFNAYRSLVSCTFDFRAHCLPWSLRDYRAMKIMDEESTDRILFCACNERVKRKKEKKIKRKRKSQIRFM